MVEDIILGVIGDDGLLPMGSDDLFLKKSDQVKRFLT